MENTVRKYAVKFTGKSPLLMHYDDIEGADRLKEWREAPANQKDKVAGDDRSPCWTWLTYVYQDGKTVVIPAANIMRACMGAAVQVPVPGSKHGKTFKSQSQSGMGILDEGWPLLIAGKAVPWPALQALADEKSFLAHCETARKFGFALDVRRAKVGTSKHVRVRPRFDRWSAAGVVTVWDEKITIGMLTDFFTIAGDTHGLGDWRPSAPRCPGPYGRFDAEVTKI